MNNLNLKAVLVLSVGVLVAVGGLIQGLHEDAYAVPECAVVCVCTTPPCGGPSVLNKVCGGSTCLGSGVAHNCDEYCSITSLIRD